MSAQRVAGIYQIRNTVNGRVYVGSALDVEKRWLLHKFQLNRGNHHCQHLQHAWVKHRETAFVFEIIEAIEDKEGFIAREQVYLDDAFATGRAYNIAPKAYSCLGVKRSAETRAKQSVSLRGKNVGRTLTPEHRAKLAAYQGSRPPASEETLARRSAAMTAFYNSPASEEARATSSAYHKGNKWGLGRIKTEEELAILRRPRSAETRAKMSASKKGVKRPAETIAKMSAARKGMTPSAEARAKMSASRKGRRHSEETLAKMRAPRPAQSVAIKAYYARRRQQNADPPPRLRHPVALAQFERAAAFEPLP